MSLARTPTDGGASPRQLLLLAIPAIVIGAFAAFLLWLLEQLADLLGGVVWETLPDALGVDPTGWWIVLILTLTGLAVGIGLRFLPGHGGPDSATTELIGPPLALEVLPGLAIVTVLGLAGGVSLGPENPIIAINWRSRWRCSRGCFRRSPRRSRSSSRGRRRSARCSARRWRRHCSSPASSPPRRAADRCGTGSSCPWPRREPAPITMHLLGAPPLAFDLPAYGSPQAIDLLTGVARRVRCRRHQPRCARRVPDRLARIARPAAPDPDPARRRVRARHPRPHRRPDHDVQGTQADRRAAAGPGPVRRRPARA